jgi:hypothetical protein
MLGRTISLHLSIASLANVSKDDYSRTRQPSLRAPASIHWLATCLMIESIWAAVEALLRKHLAFRSFHSSHATGVKRESAPLLLSPFHLSLHALHHASKESPPICDASAPSTVRMLHYTWWEKEQNAIMWSMVFGSWSHR